MTQAVQRQVQEMPQHSLIVKMANDYGLEHSKFLATLKGTVFPSGGQATNEQIAAFLVVANKYQLSPFTREIYAFPAKGGGITPIVSIDGWLSLINRQDDLDGIEFEDRFDDNGKLTAVTAKVYRKSRSHATVVTEYMAECFRNTDPWNKYPARMLRHKAMIQAARYAFGFAGIHDPDEAERIAEGENGNGYTQPIAEKTKAKVEEMKQRYAPAPVVEDIDTETDAINAIDADFVEVAAEVTVHDAEPLETAEADEEPASVSPESQLANLVAFAHDKLKELTNNKAAEVRDILNGRVLKNMDLKQVSAFIAELEKIEAERG